jgi:hypothetical protein
VTISAVIEAMGLMMALEAPPSDALSGPDRALVVLARQVDRRRRHVEMSQHSGSLPSPREPVPGNGAPVVPFTSVGEPMRRSHAGREPSP